MSYTNVLDICMIPAMDNLSTRTATAIKLPEYP
jgi:hypothetical protein